MCHEERLFIFFLLFFFFAIKSDRILINDYTSIMNSFDVVRLLRTTCGAFKVRLEIF